MKARLATDEERKAIRQCAEAHDRMFWTDEEEELIGETYQNAAIMVVEEFNGKTLYVVIPVEDSVIMVEFYMLDPSTNRMEPVNGEDVIVFWQDN